jgi:hypothetical protein
MATQLTEAQVPYTGPYGLAAGPIPKSKGPTAEALKRAMSRLGMGIEWRDFDQYYNKDLEAALDKWDPGGKNGYGDGRWKKIRSAKVKTGDHAGEWALDRYARTLIQNEAGLTADSDHLAELQKHMTEFCEIAYANGSKWRYNSDIRPVKLNRDPAKPVGTSDCSGSIIQIVDYARRKANLLDVTRDPAKQNWTGFGNTDWNEDDWPRCWSPYRVGDIGHFHSSRHVIFCISPGTQRTARWWTFGHEPPGIVTLNTYSRFPSEWMFAVRPDYVPDDD